jgi:Ca2+-binding RTX toxin-like protein
MMGAGTIAAITVPSAASAAGPSATFSQGVLTVTGSNAADTLVVSRDAAGTILVNGGAIPVVGGTPTVANTRLIVMTGRPGSDTLTLDESSGALPAANMFGGNGHDTLTGGSGADAMFGNGGGDTLLGEGGQDRMVGGFGNDTLTGGDADDEAFGQGNDDRMIWNPGDDTDLNEGGVGDDTVEVNGGGDGIDFVDGQQGADVGFLGAGDDTFQWDPGDGNDVIEGQADTDTMLFNGSGGAEVFETSANGGRILFTRNLGNIVMDTDDVERIDVNALGGADTMTVNDLSGTDVTDVISDLAGPVGGSDGEADSVIVNATDGDDVAVLTGQGAQLDVLGLAARVFVTDGAVGEDRLTVNALAGDDVIEASSVAADTANLTLNGGVDDDVLVGGEGDDILLGEAGDDVLVGGDGTDVIDGGDGDDVEIQ